MYTQTNTHICIIYIYTHAYTYKHMYTYIPIHEYIYNLYINQCNHMGRFFWVEM